MDDTGELPPTATDGGDHVEGLVDEVDKATPQPEDIGLPTPTLAVVNDPVTGQKEEVVVQLRRRNCDPPQTIEPPLRDSVPSQNLGSPSKNRPSSVFASRNGRKKMEDRHVVLHDLKAYIPSNLQDKIDSDDHISYYAVYDGHNGWDAAVYTAAHLHEKVVESKQFPTNPVEAFKDAILSLDEEFTTKMRKKSGTTATCNLIVGSHLYSAWVGDSQSILVRDGKPLRIMEPHLPNRNDELERIRALGGQVIRWGTWRVNGMLAVSRAIGDEAVKPFVCCDPDITTVKLTERDEFLIVACDGLWDGLSPAEATKIVYDFLFDENQKNNLTQLSEVLSQQAINKGSTDNISTVVVFLQKPEDIIKKGRPEDRQPLENFREGLTSTCPYTREDAPPHLMDSMDSFQNSKFQDTDEETREPTTPPVQSVFSESRDQVFMSPNTFFDLAANSSLGSNEEFRSMTGDQFRFSKSPEIPEDSVDFASGAVDSPAKDSGFISPKKECDVEDNKDGDKEVDQLLSNEKAIGRVDDLFKMLNTEDSPTPDNENEKSLEEVLAERRKLEETAGIQDAGDESDDSDDSDSDDLVKPVEGADQDDVDDSSDSDADEDFARVLPEVPRRPDSDFMDPCQQVVVKETHPEESGCLAPPVSELPSSQEAVVTTLPELEGLTVEDTGLPNQANGLAAGTHEADEVPQVSGEVPLTSSLVDSPLVAVDTVHPTPGTDIENELPTTQDEAQPASLDPLAASPQPTLIDLAVTPQPEVKVEEEGSSQVLVLGDGDGDTCHGDDQQQAFVLKTPADMSNGDEMLVQLVEPTAAEPDQSSSAAAECAGQPAAEVDKPAVAGDVQPGAEAADKSLVEEQLVSLTSDQNSSQPDVDMVPVPEDAAAPPAPEEAPVTDDLISTGAVDVMPVEAAQPSPKPVENGQAEAQDAVEPATPPPKNESIGGELLIPSVNIIPSTPVRARSPEHAERGSEKKVSEETSAINGHVEDVEAAATASKTSPKKAGTAAGTKPATNAAKKTTKPTAASSSTAKRPTAGGPSAARKPMTPTTTAAKNVGSSGAAAMKKTAPTTTARAKTNTGTATSGSGASASGSRPGSGRVGGTTTASGPAAARTAAARPNKPTTAREPIGSRPGGASSAAPAAKPKTTTGTTASSRTLNAAKPSTARSGAPGSSTTASTKPAVPRSNATARTATSRTTNGAVGNATSSSRTPSVRSTTSSSNGPAAGKVGASTTARASRVAGSVASRNAVPGKPAEKKAATTTGPRSTAGGTGAAGKPGTIVGSSRGLTTTEKNVPSAAAARVAAAREAAKKAAGKRPTATKKVGDTSVKATDSSVKGKQDNGKAEDDVPPSNGVATTNGTPADAEVKEDPVAKEDGAPVAVEPTENGSDAVPAQPDGEADNSEALNGDSGGGTDVDMVATA